MKYDPFQQTAIDYITQGYSVIVSAPTGAGKTVIAEHVLHESLKKKERVIYTAPIKALSNQKFRDFQGNFKDQIGILTGDITINQWAPVLIMTTEIFRNKILEEQSSLKNYSWIIFDEIHYLDDFERGTVWEESLVFLPQHINILGLSATIPNIEELAGWIETVHNRPIKIVKESKRPVPLHILYQCQSKIYDNLKQMNKENFKDIEYVYRHGRSFPQFLNLKPNSLVSLIKFLQEDKMLPCIYFVFSRRRCEMLAEEIFEFDFLTEEEKFKIRELYNELCAKFDLTEESSAQNLRMFVERGIAYHHAGMLPTLKEVVERLFTSKLIKVIFTTETFALGINMPAKTVVFDELRKFYGHYHGVLRTRDFYQMAGRAGRRSIDPEGFVFCRINPKYITIPEVQRIVYNQPEKVLSRFNASYATLLNLYQKYNEKLYDVYPLTFHFYQERKHARKKALELLHSKIKMLKDMGYIRKNKLTEKGLFACKVYGYELILSELYTQGVLEELSEMGLGVLCAAIVFEPRKGQIQPQLNHATKQLQILTSKIISQINKSEKRAGIKKVSKECFFHLGPAMEEWIKQKDFATTLQSADVDEGEVVRYFRMSIQILRDISDAPVSQPMKDKIRHLIGLINRDVIDSEKQLRS